MGCSICSCYGCYCTIGSFFRVYFPGLVIFELAEFLDWCEKRSIFGYVSLWPAYVSLVPHYIGLLADKGSHLFERPEALRPHTAVPCC